MLKNFSSFRIIIEIAGTTLESGRFRKIKRGWKKFQQTPNGERYE